jgi:SET domain-containing protein
MQPSNWPSHVVYLKQNQWTKEAKAVPLPTGTPTQYTQRSVKIKRISNPQHPANGQYGLFSMEKIKAKAYILDYCGIVSLHDKVSETSDYSMKFVGNLAMDAEKYGNEARMINDYRGIQEKPNAEFDHYVDQKGIWRVGVFALSQDIPKNSEILVSYGKGFWQARINKK